MTDLARELLKQKAAVKKHPEFYQEQSELAYKLQWATQMVEAGRLSKQDFKEFEAHLTSEYLAALPMDMYVSMTADGSYADLESLAAHDGTRDFYSVRKDRADLEKRVTRDALDESWAAGKIDSKRYNQEHRSIGTFDDDGVRRVNDAGDAGHDDIAGESFFNRNLPPGDLEPVPAGTEERIKDASED